MLMKKLSKREKVIMQDPIAVPRVRRSTMLTAYGTRISTMVIRDTTTSTILAGCVLFGLLTIYLFNY